MGEITVRTRLLALLFILVLAAAPAAAQEDPAKRTPSPSAQEIIFSGKLYSPLKLTVQLPYTSQIMDMNMAVGQRVKKDDVLMSYEIPLETRMSEKRTLSLALVKDLEHQAAAISKDIDKLRMKRKELEVMEKQNMATSQAIQINSQEIEVLEKQRVAVQERLAMEREQAQLRLDMARDHFGPKASFTNLPKEGIIKSPVDGYMLMINPSLRKGAKLTRDTELFQVGLLDPLIIRAQVHEIEALRLKLGDQAQVEFDSVPGKGFTATVSRIPWAPLPTTLQQPSYYEIELTLPNPDLTLKEGLKGQVTIVPKK